jgi:IS605 OrfB family transposase
LKTTNPQKKIIDEWIDTSRYIYNKTLEFINNGHSINPFELRDKLVTKDSKKNNKEYKDFLIELDKLKQKKKKLQEELKKYKKDIIQYNQILKEIELQDELIINKKKLEIDLKDLTKVTNNNIHDWELNTHKDVRFGAVNDVCKAYKTCFTNFKNGNIKHFKISYKKKTESSKCILLSKTMVKNKNGIIEIAPTYFKENKKFKMGKKTIKKHRNLIIDHDVRLVKEKGEYWLIVPVPTEIEENKRDYTKYCGIDPGVRTFMTCFKNNECIEYKHNQLQLKKLNRKGDILKYVKKLRNKKRVMKKKLNKIEIKKENLINELHWKVINDLIKRNDIIFYGDIKSHGIVKGNKNSILNRNVNDLKFYKFKERLLFKSSEKGKLVFLVNEAYTSQTCSYCGSMYKVKSSKIYDCKDCKRKMDRDINASKNILMKGLMTS